MSTHRGASQPRKYALANQKGGVGKTATALGVASAIAHRGGRVLVVDMDPQANATNGLGVEITADMPSTFDLMDRPMPGGAADIVIATEWDGVDLLPASESLARAENSGDADLVWRLDTAFDGLDLSAYAAVLFDCPPSLGRLLFAALVVADYAIAVTEPTKDSAKAVTRLEATAQTVKRRPNPRLEFGPIIISRCRNIGEHISREKELREAYGTLGDGDGLVARTNIPDLGARQDAHSEEMPIHRFRGGKAIALQVAYDDLTAELGLLPVLSNGATS